jgi:vitamin B12 transporter
MVLVDGVPVNDAGGGYDFSDLTTDNIERIEVIRGPQRALYGSNAIGSVIQIFTRRGRGPLQSEASLAGGSFNTFEGRAVVSSGSGRFGGSLGDWHPRPKPYRKFRHWQPLDRRQPRPQA